MDTESIMKIITTKTADYSILDQALFFQELATKLNELANTFYVAEYGLDVDSLED
jgi:hypothetical protein